MYQLDHAIIAGKLVGAKGFENAGHALWRIVYADGSRSRCCVIAGADALEALGLVEVRARVTG